MLISAFKFSTSLQGEVHTNAVFVMMVYLLLSFLATSLLYNFRMRIVGLVLHIRKPAVIRYVP